MSKKNLTPEQAEIKALKKEQAANNRRSFLAIVLALALAIGIFSIGKSVGMEKTGANLNSSNTGESVDENNDNDIDFDVNENQQNNTVDNTDNNQNQQQNTDNTQNNSQSNNKPNQSQNDKPASDNPADWSKEQVVEFYKQAATKSHETAESSQTMSMPKLVVNDGDGALGFFLKIANPAINSVLEKNSTTYGGITGGYANLVASDVDKYKAYKDGEYTVIEMKMVEQTDGIYGDAQGGTVGHAINVLGNVATAAEQFPEFDIKFEEADIKIHYADPIVRVRINKDGIIEKGTWSYTSEVYIRHLQINSLTVDKADAEIDYVIVVGGGF